MRNVVVLATAQVLTGSALTVVTIMGGLVAAQIAPGPALVTLPFSLAIVALALATVPAALLMRRIGRRYGFIIGALVGASGGLTCCAGVIVQRFEVFCAGALLLGSCVAFTQQYRFAAAESVPPERASRAISQVLIGALGAAIIGPQVALAGRWWIAGHEFAGSFAAISVFCVLAALVLTRLNPSAPTVPAAAASESVQNPLRTTAFRVAVLASAGASAVMTFIMTAAPISMHVVSHHSVEAATLVIQSHVLGMYVPSLFTGHVVARLGEQRVIVMGSAILAACTLFSLLGHSVMHYWWGLTLLGVGWNLAFVAGTTLLTRTLRGGNRHRGEAINDFTVFGSQACVSLLAGVVVQQIGWATLNLVTLPLLATIVLTSRRLRAA
ncbi:MAG TPA: MFS transporter [Steroidobacteraceae bacterium]|nr:MFS transporter [Steroidobacteraceae bacterium]